MVQRTSIWLGRQVPYQWFRGIVSLAVLIIFCITKFSEGAWIVIIVTPLLLWGITKISCHYDDVAKQLRIDITQERVSTKEPVIIVPVAGIHRVVAQSLNYAKSLSPNVIAFYVSFSDEDEEAMQEKWDKWDPGVRLVVFKSRYRTILKPLAEFIERVDTHVSEKQSIMVILPQFMPKNGGTACFTTSLPHVFAPSCKPTKISSLRRCPIICMSSGVQ